MRIDRRRDALIVVDLQRDFLPGGALAVGGGDAIVEPIARCAPRFGVVVATQDWHPRGHVSFASAHPGAAPFTVTQLARGAQELWPDHCVQGTQGAALHPVGRTAAGGRRRHRAGPDGDEGERHGAPRKTIRFASWKPGAVSR